uniref:Uncharacterized protein n=1 Tax=Arabidopsis thaliana TaxID=3702 RepID=Q56YM1_ARATH|nr:hypothetical protein [Arabidopsis thaliana]
MFRWWRGRDGGESSGSFCAAFKAAHVVKNGDALVEC